MALTCTIGNACSYVLGGIVRLLIGTRVHPNVLTSMGLAINTVAAWFFSQGEFFLAGVVVLCGAVFDLVDGPVARESSRVTHFGGFLDSVLDRYSDLILFMGLLVYYASIDRFFYMVLTAVVMTGSVMVSYSRARAENTIASCKVGFLERPERIVLIIIGAFSGRMAQVLWVVAVLSNITVIHRIIHTWRETRKLDTVLAENTLSEANVKQDGETVLEREAPPRRLRESYPTGL